MNHKLLIICGPTATGKTKSALQLTKVVASGPKGSGPVGELISADSRQVYRGMDIGTGKDLPANLKFKTCLPTGKIKNLKLPGYYLLNNIRLWGYDLVGPKEEFSVAHYQRIAGKVLKDIWRRGKLPILVGGTGLYVKAVVDGIPTAVVPRNRSLREILDQKSAAELFEILAQLDPVKAGSLNISDKKNPRRLVRAIEIAQYGQNHKQPSIHQCIDSSCDVLMIGLYSGMEELRKRIVRRVAERIRQGFEEEVQKLLAAGVVWNSQAMQSLGYRQWREYYEGRSSRDEAVRKWMAEEIKYAKRQMTWFKKDKRIHWFDISKRGFEKEVEKLVGKWYLT